MSFQHKPVIRQRNSTDPTVTAKYYLSNSKLLPEVIKSKEQGSITTELAEMLMMLASRYAGRPMFALYTYREDMVAEALADLCKNALKFNTERSNNPFAYYTSCIHNSFLGFLNVEKRHRKIRDQLLIEIGENPSFGFEAEYRANMDNEGVRESMTEMRGDIEDAKVRIEKERLYEAEKAKALALEAAAAIVSPELLQFDDEGAPQPATPEVAEALAFIHSPVFLQYSDDIELERRAAVLINAVLPQPEESDAEASGN